MDNPLQSLVDAYNAFRAEADRYTDRELRRASLEDAACVLRAIDAIENGINRDRFTPTQLDQIAHDSHGALSFREL